MLKAGDLKTKATISETMDAPTQARPRFCPPISSPSATAGNTSFPPGITPKDDVRIEAENLYANHPVTAYRLLLTEMHGGYAYPLIFKHLNQSVLNLAGSAVLLSLGLILRRCTPCF